MKITFGQRVMAREQGMLAPVYFPQLCLLDTRTGDGRLIRGSGFSPRELPLSIRSQFTVNDGHDQAVLSGRLDQVIIDGDVVSGYGWLLDNPAGVDTMNGLATRSLRGNSIDLADMQVTANYDPITDEFQMDFLQSRLAATTLVMTPAFADARAELADGEELVASGDFLGVSFGEALLEMTADGGPIIRPYDSFFMPEPETHQKMVVTADGRIYGHLGMWHSPHTGMTQTRLIPRSASGYANFHKPGVLTERGIVETGPIYLYGGHRTGMPKADIEKAHGAIENAWADVRVVDGNIGPWVCGWVRPGVSEENIYAARASRISGYWRSDDLYAIVSVSTEGFNVPGSGAEDGLVPNTVPDFEFSTDHSGRIVEMVASFSIDYIEEAPAPSIPAELVLGLLGDDDE